MIKNQKNSEKAQINTKAKLNVIEPKKENNGTYICSCCGKEYKRQQNNFNMSRSNLFRGNNGYLTVCKNCIDILFNQFIDFYSGDDTQALERICQIFDMYFSIEIWGNVRTINAHSSRISNYIKKLNLTQNPKFGHETNTYSDTLKVRWEEKADDIQNATSFKQVEEISESGIDEQTVKFWGLGWEDRDYVNLSSMYNDWVSEYGDPPDKSTKELYKSLCFMQMQIQNMTRAGKDGLSTIIKQFKETLNDAGLKPKGMADLDVRIDPLGVWISDIEKYTPADYYLNKSIYTDNDGIGSYFERFVSRPMRNTFLGMNEKDKDYSLSDDGDMDD